MTRLISLAVPTPFALLLACCLIFPSSQALAQQGPPRIACDQPIFDFGSRDNSEKVSHTFVVRNDGASTLNISRVKPACGCTVANISSKVLEPGQSATISANLDLKGRNGPQTKPMTVYSNDPVQGTFQLTLKGTAVSEVSITPTAVSLGRIEEGQVVTKEVKVVNNSAKPLTIKKIESTNNLMGHEIVTVRDGFEYIVKLSNSPTIPPGRISDSITITTDNAKSATQRITVYGTVLDKLTVSPNPLVLPETPGVKIDRTIYVRQGSVKQFQVLGAEWPGVNANISIANLGARGFTVSLKGIDATKALDGSEITIKTDVEDLEEIYIPVTVRASTPTAAGPIPVPAPK